VQGDVDADVQRELTAAPPEPSGDRAATWLRRLCREIASLPEFQLA
jgi:hypothetical protein